MLVTVTLIKQEFSLAGSLVQQLILDVEKFLLLIMHVIPL